MKRAPWWAPEGYRTGAYGHTLGQWWGFAVPPRGSGKPTIVKVEGRTIGVEFPWWARGVTLRRLHVESLIRRGLFR